MKIFSQITLFLSILFLVQCASDPVSDWEELNLLEYGASVRIKAPSTVKVKSKKLMDMRDIVVKDSTGDYNLQIYVSDARLEGLEESLKEIKSDIKEDPYFGGIVEEFPQGFIYYTQLDTSTTSYDFRYIEKKGNKQILFQMGMAGIQSQESVNQILKGIRE